MVDGQGNPFISNPFMQGPPKKKSVPPEARPQTQRTPEQPTQLPNPPEHLANPSKTAHKSTSAKPIKSAPKATSKVTEGAKKKKSTSRAKAKKNTVSAPSPSPTPSYTGNGYKVQVLAKIPMPTNTNMPSRDYLWFAVYPIIPRVGDCIFHDGRYFRVDAVFLYENTNAGWCADLEVSYYTRRH
ncbi:MAG: hypothetical protein AAF959_05615 [Cyanobacteria bacterium P01_D01_bin.56]